MVRVRYAPSPTGLQHIGGVRTALYNYFFARSQNGKFILRVEDTDRERYSDESLEDLYATLSWLGLDADEGPNIGGAYGPYVQSERIELYQKAAHDLVEKGKAYYCFCSQERLQELVEKQKAEKKDVQGYDRHCSTIPLEEAKKRIANGEKYVIRLRVPVEGETAFDDIILGHIKRKNRDVTPDPILLKSDGFPTYHLANVIDDHLMEITHIMRAQEWVASVPLHILLYRAFGWEPPKFCHLPMVMGNDGQKLSKRHGSTSVRDFIKKGYLPEALINYVTLVGWSFDDKTEFFTKEELEKCFDIHKIHSAPGVFDYKKLDWFNGQYIRKLSDERLSSLIYPYMKESRINVDEKDVIKYIPLIKERIKVLSDAPLMLRFLFETPKYTEKEKFLAKKQELPEATLMLKEAERAFSNTEDGEKTLSDFANANGIKMNNVFMPLRVAITGESVSPPLGDSIKILGKDEKLKPIKSAIEFLNK